MGTDAATKTLSSGDAFDRCPHDRHFARGEIEHAIDSTRIPCRAFAFHSAAQSLQHGLGIEGKVGGIHRALSVFQKGSFGWRMLRTVK